MKKNIFIFLGVAVITLAVAGCSHNNDDANSNGSGNVNGNVNGETVIEEGLDGGVFKSTDQAKTFTQKVAVSGEVTIAEQDVLSMELDPQNPDTIYIGTRESSLYRTTNGGDSWVQDINNFTNVNDIVVDPINSQTIYIAAMRGGRGKILKTTNGAEQWNEIFTQRSDGPSVLSLAVDYNNSSIIYAGDSQGAIYKSEDSGSTWKTVLWARSSIRQITMDNVNSSIVYFGTTNSGALVSADGGSSFTTIIGSDIIYDIKAHPSKENAVFVSNPDGLQVSFDRGQTWKIINTLVKPEKVNSRALAIDPRNDSIIYYSSGQALYKSTNRGESWAPVQFNVSRGIDIVEINPKNTDTIYLGMRNRQSGGFFQLFPGTGL